MTRRHTIRFDPFDTLDDVDGFDGFILDDEADEAEEAWYKAFAQDTVFCENGFGDDEELCVRDRYPCYFVGCEHSDD